MTHDAEAVEGRALAGRADQDRCPAACPAGSNRQGKAITQLFQCEGFPKAIELVNAVAAIAQRLDHHPDILIQYDKATFTLSSHDAGGVTERDLKLAKEIDAAAERSGATPQS